ncbi:uncharacterized protein LOC123533433 [Mercenaria mercenaria]|uniref:uncharacterized protein LOC123533433 n=1 Tax=Mercenaria mercenaria TaxID=6596 RepID=UPI00234F6640|nr:uncharacterized protein LOC123533433 [Mercenaria mercenaria]
MMLFKDKGMERKAELEDKSGKKLPALTVFSLSIEYLKNEVLDTLGKQADSDLGVGDIHWVLTVPAIWNDAAKQFMREAAQKAGIPAKNLTICLEPEAASIYCRHLPVVIGCRRENVACSVLVRNKVPGSDAVLKFKNKRMDDYIELFRYFEHKKRDISPTKSKTVTIRMPANLSKLCSEMRKSDLKEFDLQSRFSGKVKVLSDKLRIDVDVVREFFLPAVRNIMDHVATLPKEPSVNDCAAILMVGGFLGITNVTRERAGRISKSKNNCF